MDDYIDNEFRRRVEEALIAVTRVLEDESRKPRIAGRPAYGDEGDQHTYNDKFTLAEFLTQMAVSAVRNVLEWMGLKGEKLQSLIEVAKVEGRPVTLRFEAQETCEFLGERAFRVNDPQTHASIEDEEATHADKTSRTTRNSKTIVRLTEVKEYRWKVGVRHILSVFVGVGDDRGIIASRDGSCEVVTNTKESPLPSHNIVHPAVEVPLTWFLRCIDPNNTSCVVFEIDRDSDQCRTPRRNREIAQGAEFFETFGTCWAHKVCLALLRLDSRVRNWRRQRLSRGESTAPSGNPASILDAIKSSNIFVPVLPLFVHSRKRPAISDDPNEIDGNDEAMVVSTTCPATTETSSAPCPLLHQSDRNKLLGEQSRTMDMAAHQITISFPPHNSPTEIVTSTEAHLALLLKHAVSICSHYLKGIDHLENMLRGQLAAAVGKHLTQNDFEEFARFHYSRKLFCKEYVPRAFCHAIRRPGDYPDGMVSIETVSDSRPIQTFTRLFDVLEDEAENRFMQVSINAATQVKIGGKCYLHAWLLHKFGGGRFEGSEERRRRTLQQYQLVARAREFSCFMLILGRISGPDSFDPQDAIIVQNKDEVFLPLVLEELPTPKEFRDAVASLSPEQRSFAQAYRQMQLESSVFGLCVVQLKPQLELLLGLSPKSLTKEVKLTQDLLQLFIKYQIPSDLLSFDGCTDGDSTSDSTTSMDAGFSLEIASSDKLNAVKNHVKNVQAMIQDRNEEDLLEAEQRADMDIETDDWEGGATSVGGRGGRGGGRGGGAGCGMGRRGGRGGRGGGGGGRGGTGGGGGGRRGGGGGLVQIDSFDMLPRKAGARMAAADPPPPPQPANMVATSADSVEERSKSSSAGSRLVDDACDSPTATARGSFPRTCVPAADGTASSSPSTIDFTSIPKELDTKMAIVDVNSALRTTTVKVGATWTKESPQNLLSPEVQTTRLDVEERRKKRIRAFDLLDALSRSGSLPIRFAELHVIVAATHTFDKSVVDTVIEDNINPIDEVERSALLMATTVHGLASPEGLLQSESEVLRIAQHSSSLFTKHNLDVS